ncbi:MAG: hypothetical protein K2N44_17710 [Lachnospiraceae bacterium]|nr:hypothetical protein [Lachnospiraceae bacterium]
MIESMFNEIFDREILPLIDEIQQNNGLIRKKNIETCKKEIYNEYNVLRADLKDKIFGDKSADKVLDRHKVAACICAAFLKVSVFDRNSMINRILETRERVEAYFFYVNEIVAFEAGCRFLSFFMISECVEDRNKAERIIREFPKLPPVKTSTLDCYDCIVFNLSQINTEKIGIEHFDIYSYSMFFFLLESYYNTQAA